MPPGGSKSSGDASLGSVLLMILILGGAMIGVIFLLGHCAEDDPHRGAPSVHVDAGSRP